MRTSQLANVVPITRNQNLERLVSRLGALLRTHRRGPHNRLTPEARKTLGTSIQERRERAGLSRYQLAERAGMAYSTVYYLETGTRESRNGSILAVCNALGASFTAVISEAWGRV